MHMMLPLVVPGQSEEAGTLVLVREESGRLTEFYSINKLKKEAGEYLKSCSPAYVISLAQRNYNN